MADLKFRCFKCNTVSEMNLNAEGRDRARRIGADPSVPREVTFYCESCGVANSIPVSAESLNALLARVTSDDPTIQRAIDDAKRGDYGTAINEARRRFGF